MSKPLLWKISNQTGFKVTIRQGDACGMSSWDAPDDSHALSSSAFSNFMTQWDCAKPLAPQLTSLNAFQRESGAFQGMEKSTPQKLNVASWLGCASSSRETRFQISLPLHLCRDTWRQGRGDMMHCFVLLCPAPPLSHSTSDVKVLKRFTNTN